MTRRRFATRLFCLLLVLAVTFLSCSCRGRKQASPEPTVDPNYVPTSVAQSLAAAATHRASLGTPTATSSALPPTATPEPATATPTVVLVQAGAAPLTGQVTSDGLRLRKGPGTMYSALGALYAGDAIEITGRSEAADWLEVIAPDGRSGWVFAEYVDLAVPLASVPVATDIPPTPEPAAAATTQP